MRVGVDVGGTNTDAVLMAGRRVVSKEKTATTPDVTTGVVRALEGVLAGGEGQPLQKGIQAVMLGTTHFMNALLEGRGLARTAVLRLCGPSTRLLPPFCDWPDELRAALGGHLRLLPGGHEFDGREISSFDDDAVRDALRDALANGVETVALSGVFSPVNPAHESRAAELIRQEWPDIPVTLSSEIGRIGLLERENAAALNAALSRIAARTVEAIRGALADMGLAVPVFFSQNDGTLMDAEYAARYPVLAMSSGPTNSMRGAAFLAGIENAVVVDVGGTSTDVGILVQGFPRAASTAVKLAEVRTNFRMPDLISIALGGGSIVRRDPLAIGPSSVGARITDEAIVFGGATLTATDLAVAAGRALIGEPARARALDPDLVERGLAEVRRRVEEAVDRVKLSAEPLPLVLVGGGSLLLGDRLAGASEVVRPEHAEVANAIGAAIAQVGGEVEKVYSLERVGRLEALAAAKQEAVARATEAGAQPGRVEVVEVEEVPLTYLPGNATRIRVKAVGELGQD
ncbi:MAG: hydantoinase/oxoprolinase family protein [Gemmatimonadota bacterium]|nr:MAG: hydantoinase/oxoprolinase family protein [Gemmatimonadota bacterium]